jgi:hypothetical protein
MGRQHKVTSSIAPQCIAVRENVDRAERPPAVLAAPCHLPAERPRNPDAKSTADLAGIDLDPCVVLTAPRWRRIFTESSTSTPGRKTRPTGSAVVSLSFYQMPPYARQY